MRRYAERRFQVLRPMLADVLHEPFLITAAVASTAQA